MGGRTLASGTRKAEVGWLWEERQWKVGLLRTARGGEDAHSVLISHALQESFVVN